MYHVCVQAFPQSVLTYISRHYLLKPGDRVGAAVSGGADSVALLRLLLELRGELGIVLSVVHFNHKLRGADSDADEGFVAALAAKLALEFHCESGDVTSYARQKRLSLETAAREMRYRYFRRLLEANELSRVATAHTLDDQAETVLLRMVRGAGSRGLAGIYPQLLVPGAQPAEGNQGADVKNQASIVRPLLATRRKDLEGYLLSLGQGWREDQSNRDLRHTRNRIRHGILPRLERNLNPAVREALAEGAEIARAEEEYWDREIARLLPQLWEVRRGAPSRARGPAKITGVMNLAALASLPLALQRHVLRAACESLGLRLEFGHVEQALALISPEADSPKSAALPEGWTASRFRRELRFFPAESTEYSDYEHDLPVPGTIDIPEANLHLEASLVSGNALESYNPEHLVDSALLGGPLRVRNWRPGDRYLQAHTKAPKKIKELLQERHLTGWERKLWPVVVSGTEVVWLRGFPVPVKWRPKSGRGGVLITETPLSD